MESDLNVRFNKRYGRWTAGVNTPFKLYKSPKLYYNIIQTLNVRH
jgi:hypothetical protein